MPVSENTNDGGTAESHDEHKTQFGELLDLLGIDAHERIAICSQSVGGKFNGNTVPVNRSDSEKLSLSTPYVEKRDVWFGVNPVALPSGYLGRGTDDHVTRAVALFADIDIKRGGVDSSATADTVARSISEKLGQLPVAVVFTGHGGHAYWTLDPEDDAWTLDTPTAREDANAVYSRFHRLCANVAEMHGGSVDKVSQLSRILRVPGTFNRKDPSDPILADLRVQPYGASGPLSFREVVEALDAYGVPELPEDREHPGEAVCAPEEWTFGDQTTAYVGTMIDRWRTDTPRSGVNRHSWLVSQSVRLACSHRLGRITADDNDKAVQVLVTRFTELLEAHGDPREATPGEVAGAAAWGVRKAATFADDRAAEEVGGDALAAKSGSDLNRYLTLPDEYWNAHPVLAHIRLAARASGDSPDGVMGALHARLAASLHPGCRLDTGMKQPTGLHAYVLLCDDHGGGKSTAMQLAADLLLVAAPPHMDVNRYGIAVSRDTYDAGALGTGQGVAAQFVEWRPVDPDKPKGTHANLQVRSNVLFTTDEGESVSVELRKPSSTLGSELRAGWSGRRIGTGGNARIENRRNVDPGTYSLGVAIGMQTPTLRDILTDREHRNGTGPRLDAYWMPDPDAPDVRPPAPSRLMLDAGQFTGVMRLCDDMQAEMERHALRNRRGEIAAEDNDRHKYLSIARRAARLMLLCEAVTVEDGIPVRTEADPFATPKPVADDAPAIVVEPLFWKLAVMEYEVSTRIKAHAEALSRAERKGQHEARVKAAVEQGTAVDAARRAAARTDQLTNEQRIEGRIVRFLDKHGPTPWAGKNGIWQKCKDSTEDRDEWQRVLDRMVDDDVLTLSGGSYSPATAS